MKLSIITATYNCESFLKYCLDSVASQDNIASIEHIIIDGKSTDNSVAIAASYPHISVIHSASDRGIYHAFNKGVSLSSGDVVCFLGADDSLFDNTALASVMQAFESSDIDYVITRVKCFNEETGESWLTETSSVGGKGVCHQGFFCKKTLFESIGPFSECFSLCADSFFMRQAIKHYKGKQLDIISANFRQEGVSSKGANRHLLKREMQAVSLLMGDDVQSQEQQLDRNVLALKDLLQKSLHVQESFRRYKAQRVGVFGTRQLSICVAGLLDKSDSEVACFVISDNQEVPHYKGTPVVSLEQASTMSLDYIINCIEGEHESRITTLLSQHLVNTKVISWRNL